MSVHVFWFLVGLLLLWFPRRWLRFGASVFRRRRKRHAAAVEPWRAHEPGDPRVKFTREFTRFRNYIDLFRAGVGSVLLMGAPGLDPSLAAAPDATRAQVLQVMALKAAVLLVGLLVQTLRHEHRRVSLYPPIFYVAGLSVGLCDTRAAAFAFVLIWAFTPGLPNAQAFLTVYALMLVTFGHLFAGQRDAWVMLAGALCFLPVLLSLLAKRPLTILSRKSTRSVVHP